jgi:hypothetical protein
MYTYLWTDGVVLVRISPHAKRGQPIALRRFIPVDQIGWSAFQYGNVFASNFLSAHMSKCQWRRSSLPMAHGNTVYCKGVYGLKLSSPVLGTLLWLPSLRLN